MRLKAKCYLYAMTTITKNQFTFWGRIIFIVPLIWLFLKPIQNTLTKDVDTFHLLLLVFFLTFVILIASFLFLGLLIKPTTLTFSNNERQFYTFSILSGNTTYSISDIKGFSKTKLWTRAKDYPGILLYLKDNSKVELTEFNLQSLTPFMKFLHDENVNFFGEETSWFPFRPIRFRYDK